MEQLDYKPTSIHSAQSKEKPIERSKNFTQAASINKQINTQTRQDFDRRDFIKETLKTSIKLKIKLQKQAALISSNIELSEEEIISRLNKFIRN